MVRLRLDSEGYSACVRDLSGFEELNHAEGR